MEIFSSGKQEPTPNHTLIPSKSDKKSNNIESESTPASHNLYNDAATLVSFKDLGVQEWLCETLASVSILTPTQVQKSCIPPLLKRKNTIAVAATGQGKTATFAVPIIQNLAQDKYGVFSLILTPTRELAYQMDEQIKIFGQAIGLVTCVITGGMDSMKQSIDLFSNTKSPHIIIATPGRLVDLVSSEYASRDFKRICRRLAYLVLDEADRLIGDSSFQTDLMTILSLLPGKEERCTVLATATYDETPSISISSSNSSSSSFFGLNTNKEDYFIFYNNNKNIDNAMNYFKIVDTLDQRYLIVPSKLKDAYLSYLLLEHERLKISNGETKNNNSTVIIFVGKRKICDLVRIMLQEMGVPCVALHAGMRQKDRLKSLALFRAGSIKVLVTTDLASRGLDIPHVSCVINYTLPLDVRDYVHRVGRTARAGKGGLALSLIGEMDVSLVKNIESKTNKKWLPLNHVNNNGEKSGDDENVKSKNSTVMKLDFEKETLKLLKRVLQAKRVASMAIIEKYK